MKKMLALMAVLVVLSVGSIGVIGAAVNAEKDQVVFTEKIVRGDPSLAEGITVKTRTHYLNHLFWESTYSLGNQKQCLTDYDFSLAQRFEEGHSHYEGLSLQLGIWFEADMKETPVDQLTGVSKAFRELYDRLEPGEEQSKQIRLKDYYDYYPIAFTLTLPGDGWPDYDYFRFNGTPSEEAAKQTALFNDFFKIPVLDSDTLELSIAKPDGKSNVSKTSGFSAFDAYSPDTSSTYTSDKCYFTISDQKANGEKIDMSLIPGGYGIYALSYDSADDDGKSRLYADTLETVYPLDEEVHIFHLTTNAEQNKLLLFTSEQNATYLSVIDIETMKTVQKLQLFEEALEYLPYVWEYEDFLVLQQSENELSVVTLNDDGEYELTFTTSVESDYSYFMNYDVTMAFDGKRLVIADQLYDTQSACDFYVTIYDESGQRFYAEYQSSLSPDCNSSYGKYAQFCIRDTISVQWNEND